MLLLIMSQGAMAWNSLYLRGAGYDWDSNSSGSEFTKIDGNTFKKVYTAAGLARNSSQFDDDDDEYHDEIFGNAFY